MGRYSSTHQLWQKSSLVYFHGSAVANSLVALNRAHVQGKLQGVKTAADEQSTERLSLPPYLSTPREAKGHGLQKAHARDPGLV